MSKSSQTRDVPESSNGSLDATLRHELDQLRDAGLYRKLRRTSGQQAPRMIVDGREVVMVAGANYLGLAAHPEVIQAARDAIDTFGCAAGSARLISGNLPLHESLELDLASFLKKDAALLFSSGYAANLGVITALAGPQDVVVSDALNHASIIDACRLSGAETRVFQHNDMRDFGRVLQAIGGYRRRLFVVDGVFSMEGDSAALGELVPLARQHDMTIVLDDAHGFGILGRHGRGSAEQDEVDVDIHIGNLGKALGSFGAFVACSAEVRDYLVNRARTFIFTCGLPPSAVAGARAALKIMASEPERRTRLLAGAAQLRDGLSRVGYDVGTSTTHIVPAIIGDNETTMQLSEAALELGVFAQGIRYPSVPRGTARIRFTPTSEHSSADLDRIIQVFGQLRDGNVAGTLRVP